MDRDTNKGYQQTMKNFSEEKLIQAYQKYTPYLTNEKIAAITAKVIIGERLKKPVKAVVTGGTCGKDFIKHFLYEYYDSIKMEMPFRVINGYPDDNFFKIKPNVWIIEGRPTLLKNKGIKELLKQGWLNVIIPQKERVAMPINRCKFFFKKGTE